MINFEDGNIMTEKQRKRVKNREKTKIKKTTLKTKTETIGNEKRKKERRELDR